MRKLHLNAILILGLMASLLATTIQSRPVQAGADPKIIVNEFYRSGTFVASTGNEWAELVLVKDLTAAELDAFSVGDSTATPNAKYGAYKFTSMSGIAANFPKGTMIVVGGGAAGFTQDITYDPAGGDWNLSLTTGGGYLTNQASSNTMDLAGTDIAWVDTSASGSTISAEGFGVKWGSGGTMVPDVAITAPANNSYAYFNSNLSGIRTPANWLSTASHTIAQPNGGDNTIWINSLRTTTTPPSASGTATPNSVAAGDTSLLTVVVTPGTNPASTSLSVSANLSAIGGSATQTFYNDGTHGDVTASDNTFSFQASVAVGTPVGAKSLSVTVSDAQARTGSTNIALTIVGPTNPSGAGTAAPSSVAPLDAVLLRVAVTPGTLPASTGLTVSVNLSAIGGSATQTFYDNGTNGDVTAGDNTFSFQTSVAAGTTTGAKSLPATIADAQARSGSASIALTVAAPAAPSGTGAAAPASGLPGATTLLTVTVTPGTGPVSTGLTVTANLSAIGGSATQTFYDNGTNGDLVSADNIFSFQATVAVGTSTGSKSLAVTIADAQSRTASTSIAFTVNAASGCGAAATYIHDVQGTGTASPLAGSSRTIEGIVIGDYQTGGLQGYFVQEEDSERDGNAATSEGMYVYDGANAVSVGDKVRVTGTVVEYGTAPNTLTELSPVTSVTVCASGQSALVTVTTLNLPLTNVSDQEAFEGMLVKIPQELTVVNNYSLGRYGEIGLAQGGYVYQFTHANAPSVTGNANYQSEVAKRVITLDDGNSAENPDPIIYPAPTGLTAANTLRLGYTLPNGLTGIVDQRNNVYKIQAVGTINFNTATNPRPATAPVVGGTMRVAFMNLLNYFNGNGSGGGFPTARGATTAAEFTRQRNKTIPAMHGVDAAVIGVMEVENDYDQGTLSAIYDLVSGLNAVAGAGTYAYINPGAKVGSDQIAVGIIYKPALVTPVGTFKTLTTGAFSASNRVPIAQTFQQITTGEKFTVVVNHFKSKGSACSGDPDLGDGQGNCNQTRVAAARDLATWLGTDPTGSADPDFVIMGDLNAYASENPITTLIGRGYTNLLNKFLGNESYSFQFSGQVGYLDHMLASSSLTDQTDSAAEWHINSAEPVVMGYLTEYKTTNQITSLYAPDPYYAADHDPAIIGLNLATDESDLALTYGSARHSRSQVYLGTKFADGHSAVGTVANAATSTNDGVRPIGSWSVATGGAVDVTVTSPSGGYVSGWIDWNKDGDFSDTGENVLNNAAFGSGVVMRTLTFAIPGGTTVAGSTFNARFRVYAQAQLLDARPLLWGGPQQLTNAAAQPSGDVIGGETEDFTWEFGPTAIELQSFGAHSTSPVFWPVLGVGLLGLGLALRRRSFHV